MSLRARPPFRADHVGSLLRPAELLAARYAKRGQAPCGAELRSLEDRCIVRAIRRQEELGLRSITDGEFRRESWRLGLVSKVAGLSRADAVGDVDYQHDAGGERRRIGNAPVATGKLRRTGPIVCDDVRFALAHTHHSVKATLPSPSYLHYPRGAACVDPQVYSDLDAFFQDVVTVYREEIQELYETGGRYLQFDEVVQALLCDDRLRGALCARGDDPDQLSDLYIDLINRCIRDRPADLYVAVHMCRGNALGGWMGTGSYERIAQKVFNQLDVDAFFLEYDTERAGGFEPLRLMPGDKMVVLGLVSTKSATLESGDALKASIEAASDYVPLERLCLSPQCGFASADRGTSLSQADQEAKLALVVETAAAVWGEG